MSSINSNRLFQVFVSSTYEDLKPERSEAIKALLEIDCMPVGMEYFPASDTDQWTTVKKLIGMSDYYVLITAGRYGSIEAQSKLSFTELEYDYAQNQGIQIISFIYHDINELKGKFLERSPSQINRLRRFHEKVRHKLCRFYTTPQDLASSIKSSLLKLQASTPRPGWVRAADSTAGYFPIRFDLNSSTVPMDDLWYHRPSSLLLQRFTIGLRMKQGQNQGWESRSVRNQSVNRCRSRDLDNCRVHHQGYRRYT